MAMSLAKVREEAVASHAQADCLLRYRVTAANIGASSNDWKLLSSALKCSTSLPESESTVVSSIAVFSTGEALIFLYKRPAFSTEERVAAAMLSEVITLRLKSTPWSKSTV